MQPTKRLKTGRGTWETPTPFRPSILSTPAPAPARPAPANSFATPLRTAPAAGAFTTPLDLASSIFKTPAPQRKKSELAHLHTPQCHSPVNVWTASEGSWVSALECVFQHLDRPSIARAACVSRVWSKAADASKCVRNPLYTISHKIGKGKGRGGREGCPSFLGVACTCGSHMA